MKALRFAVVGALLFAACQDDNHRFENNEAASAAQEARLAALEAKLGMLPDPTAAASAAAGAAVKPVSDRLAALEAMVAKLQPTKQVYLVAKGGTVDEKVIGLISGTGCAWSAEFGAELCFNSTFDVQYANSDCTGDAFIDPSRYVPNRLVRGNGGAVYIPTPAANEFPVNAFQRPGGACVERPVKLVAYPLKSMGLIPLYDPNDFSVQLR